MNKRVSFYPQLYKFNHIDFSEAKFEAEQIDRLDKENEKLRAEVENLKKILVQKEKTEQGYRLAKVQVTPGDRKKARVAFEEVAGLDENAIVLVKGGFNLLWSQKPESQIALKSRGYFFGVEYRL